MSKDLLFQDEIRNVVARAYSAIPSGGGKDATDDGLHTPRGRKEAEHGA